MQKIKFNTGVFNLLLEKQKRLSVSADGLGICLGNPNAANTIIKVCNLYCGPCAKAHSGVEKLLEENKDLKAQIIFTATNNENDSRALPAKHLIAIADQGNETLTKNALNDWYLAEKKDYNVFAEKYPMNGEVKIQGEKLDAMKQWCDKVEISFTPTFFYNGHQLPDVYNLGDLKYFLAE